MRDDSYFTTISRPHPKNQEGWETIVVIPPIFVEDGRSSYWVRRRISKAVDARYAEMRYNHKQAAPMENHEVRYATSLHRTEKQSGGPADEWRRPLPYHFTKLSPTIGPLVQGFKCDMSKREWSESVTGGRLYHGEIQVRPHNGTALPIKAVNHLSVGSNRGALENSAMRQVKSQSMNAAMALLESRQSIQLLGEYIRRASGVLKAIRKKDPRLLKQSFRVIRTDRRYTRKSADLWLETWYGLMPILSDATNLAALTRDGFKEKEQLLVARASSRGANSSTLVYTDRTNGQRSFPSDRHFPRWNFECHSEISTVLQEKCNLWFKVSDVRLIMAKELGFTNPASLAWDAIPLWSLLTDWVYPVGQFLDLLDYDLGLSFKGGAFTTFRETVARVPEIHPGSSSMSLNRAWSWESGGLSKPGSRIDFDRTVYNKPPQPNRPTIRNPFQVDRAISSVALLRQRIK